SLAACEGALLVVDAGQGVEAQTLANFYLAYDSGLEIVPVINKIDLPAADVEGTRAQITEALGLDGDEALTISAKHGTGVPEVLEAIVQRIPPPRGNPEAPLKALVFDSFYDSYQGVVVYVRVLDGRVAAGTKILLMSSGKHFEVQQVGVFTPQLLRLVPLTPGRFGLARPAAAPSVRYRVVTGGGETRAIDNPAKLQHIWDIGETQEPYVRGSVFVPTEFMGPVYKPAQDARGEHRAVEHIGRRVH